MLIFDCTGEKKCSIHYRMLKIYVRHGMRVVKVHETFSIEQSKWLKKYISFNTQKGIRAKNIFEKYFVELINNGFLGQMLEDIINRIKIKFIKNCENDKIIKQ